MQQNILLFSYLVWRALCAGTYFQLNIFYIERFLCKCIWWCYVIVSKVNLKGTIFCIVDVYLGKCISSRHVHICCLQLKKSVLCGVSLWGINFSALSPWQKAHFRFILHTLPTRHSRQEIPAPQRLESIEERPLVKISEEEGFRRAKMDPILPTSFSKLLCAPRTTKEIFDMMRSYRFRIRWSTTLSTLNEKKYKAIVLDKMAVSSPQTTFSRHNDAVKSAYYMLILLRLGQFSICVPVLKLK